MMEGNSVGALTALPGNRTWLGYTVVVKSMLLGAGRSALMTMRLRLSGALQMPYDAGHDSFLF